MSMSFVFYSIFATRPVGCNENETLSARAERQTGAYITVLMAAIIIVIDGTGRLHHRPLAHMP